MYICLNCKKENFTDFFPIPVQDMCVAQNLMCDICGFYKKTKGISIIKLARKKFNLKSIFYFHRWLLIASCHKI